MKDLLTQTNLAQCNELLVPGHDLSLARRQALPLGLDTTLSRLDRAPPN